MNVMTCRSQPASEIRETQLQEKNTIVAENPKHGSCHNILSHQRDTFLVSRPIWRWTINIDAPIPRHSKHLPHSLTLGGLHFFVDTSLLTYHTHNNIGISGTHIKKSMAIRGPNNSPLRFGQSLWIYGNIETRFSMKQTQCTPSAAWNSSDPLL